MDKSTCPKLEKCPIFQKGVLFSDKTGESYKNLYCLKENKFPECKRYIVSSKTGMKIPENIMPNSSLTIEQIIEKIKPLQ